MRFLVAMPLLIIAELVVHQRMRPIAGNSWNGIWFRVSAMTRFDTAIASAFRLRNSVLAEVLLIAFVYGVGVLVVWRHYIALDTTTWYAAASGDSARDSRSPVSGTAT